MTEKSKEKSLWESVASSLQTPKVKLGYHWTYNVGRDPKRLGFVLSRYKFSAKMASKNSHVLELGCSEGIGATILGETAKSYTGIDLDESAILAAQENLGNFSSYKFIHDDFLGKVYGSFDSIVSLDVIEHIPHDMEELFFETVMQNLSKNGVCVIGTPNISSAAYASPASQLGHINLYSQERLKKALSNYFHSTFLFGMNDEILHTGFAEMAHYIFCVACDKKQGH